MAKQRRSQALHVIGQQAGGAPSKRAWSRNVQPFEIPDDWQPDTYVPETRDECRDGPRPCTHVRCSYHLWVTDGADRAGRHRGQVPTELVASSITSCERDVVERRGALSAEGIGEVMGLSPRRVQQIVKRALAKLGVNRERLRGLLR